jgi:hypothetical protein
MVLHKLTVIGQLKSIIQLYQNLFKLQVYILYRTIKNLNVCHSDQVSERGKNLMKIGSYLHLAFLRQESEIVFTEQARKTDQTKQT